MLLAILCAVAKIRELFFGHVTQQLLGGLEKLIHFELLYGYQHIPHSGCEVLYLKNYIRVPLEFEFQCG